MKFHEIKVGQFFTIKEQTKQPKSATNLHPSLRKKFQQEQQPKPQRPVQQAIKCSETECFELDQHHNLVKYQIDPNQTVARIVTGIKDPDEIKQKIYQAASQNVPLAS